ncbi:MAG: YtxH domain-containing protein [Chitinophagaceae bacterium]|nr:YtxH domain-containing protein [Chitinophagaceae bacterium]
MSKLFVGFAAGLLVGVLFAPDRGTETRDRIARRGRELKDKFNDLVDSVSSKFDNVQDEVDDFAEKAKQKARAYSNETGTSWAG